MKRGDAIIVCGLGFGDEGKGTVTDFLARHFGPATVVRYNGGPQAAHNVVASDGRWHCFAQFGAGSLAPGAASFLSRHMLIDPESMAAEARALETKGLSDPWSLQTVDPDCLLATPMQKIVGRMREIARGAKAHGSCGMGVGETILDAERGLALRVRDVLSRDIRAFRELAGTKAAEAAAIAAGAPSAEMSLAMDHFRRRSDFEALSYAYRQILGRPRIEDGCDALKRIESGRTIIFEGAQGALLDRRRGFIPHVTKSDTSRRNALGLLAEAGITRRAFTLGVLRAYGHRHGAGPFVSEDRSLRERLDDRHNPENRWQGPFRVGWLDLPSLRYSIRINGGVDALAVTGLDRLAGLERIRVCTAYMAPDGRRLTDLPDDPPGGRTSFVAACRPAWTEVPDAKALIRLIEDGLGAPVAIVSTGPTSEDKILR